MERYSHIALKHTVTSATTRQFSSGKHFIFLYLAKGTCYFDVDDQPKFCSTEDIILLKPGEKTVMRFRGGKYQLTLLEIRISPEYLCALSDDKSNLLEDFQFVPYKVSVVRADSETSMLIKNITLKLTDMASDVDSYGHELYERGLFLMVLVLSMRACINADKVHRGRKRKNILMDDIFRYIREHLTEDLTLEQLEKEFFVSRYHICREFKRTTGQTPHAYIVKTRLDHCKKYIEEGKSIRDVYQLGGFGGYNHFFRAFKKEYGMTPMEYYKSLRLCEEDVTSV